MAWMCFDYCRTCDQEHQIYIDQPQEPEPKALFEYHCRCSPGVIRRFRYAPLYSEPAPSIPPGAIVARPAKSPALAFCSSLVVEAAGTAVALHISAT